MGLFNKLFGGSKPADNRENEKKFDILKYDGIRALNIGKTQYAVKCLEEAVALQPDAEAYSKLAEAFMRLGRDEDVRATLVRFAETCPEDARAHLLLSQYLYEHAEYAGMKQSVERALALKPQAPELLYQAALAAVGLNDVMDAIVKLTQAIAQREDYADAYLVRAQVLWGMKQAKEAIADVDKLLELDADNEQALLLKGRILAVTGKVPEAIALFRKVLSMNPFFDDAYIALGAIHIAANEYDAAIAVYDEALEINPQFAQAYHERGRAKLLKGDKDGSVEDIKQAMVLAPEKAAALSGEYHNYEQPQPIIPFG
jgi:tetratricopeptide (TPR) repeat protein